MADLAQGTVARSGPQTRTSTDALQRKCGCGKQSKSGECAECERKRQAVQRQAVAPWQAKSGRPQDPAGNGHDFSRVRVRRSALARVQPQLLITAPRDEYEHEADRVADIVCRPGTAGPPIRISPFVHRQPAVERSTEDEAADDSAPALEVSLMAGAAAGQPLSAPVRERMEDRFGVRFNGVRIHTGSDADRLANDIDALAFTHGRHIYFSSGAYAPGTSAGDRLLAHELTHVVQQSGGVTPHATGVVQRGFTGSGFHAGTEERFLAANKGKGLITEAPLPGATTFSPFDFEKVGFPDLYKSDAVNTAIGVRGEWETAKDVNPSDDPTKKRRYVPLKPGERKAKSDAGSVAYSPKPQGDTQPLTGEFPNSVEVGDIKPIWVVAGRVALGKPGEGTTQLGNYQKGIAEFVRTAAADKKVSRGTIGKVGVLSGLAVPPELNYKDFEKENKSPSPKMIGFHDRTGARRYWMFEPPGTGVYYYFHLAHPNPSPEAREKLEDTFKKLEPIKQELHTPDDGIHNKLDLPKLPKRRTASARRQRAATRAVQRKETPRVKKDWDALGKAWEAKRADWDQKSAKPFLGSPQAKALDERVAVNNLVGLKHDTSPGSIAELGKHLKSIELWSGATGKGLGILRFKLGTVFDKVAGAFDWIKGKLTGFWNKLTGAQSPSVGFGWRKTLVNLLMKAIKLGFRQLVSVFFELCANCLEAIIGRIINKFTEDISEQLRQQIEKLHNEVDKFEKQIKTEFEQRFGNWNQLIDDLSSAQKWADLLLTMEALIRLGFQVVSCLTPPALGCLWGLVVQVSLDIALSLVMGTEWFQEHVVNHPTIRDMIKQFAGPTIRSLIADTLRAIGLEEYANELAPCNNLKQLEPPPVPPIDPITPDQLQQRRADFETANRQQMVADLRFRLHRSPGEPASEGDLDDLVAAISRSGKSTEELKRLIESTPKWSNGKFDIGAIKKRLIETEPPPVASGGRPSRPDIGLGKRGPASGPRIEFGPRKFEPPPNAPPGQGGSVAPGGGISF